jgi:hypothetical protein
MQGKTIKMEPGEQTAKGAKIKWDPDRTPMDTDFTEEGVPQQGDGHFPSPHLPFDPFGEQGVSDNEAPPPSLPGELPQDTIT